jgi:hypothetical protein
MADSIGMRGGRRAAANARTQLGTIKCQTRRTDWATAYLQRERRFRAAKTTRLGTLTTDTARELDVLWHDGDALGVNRAQIGILEQADKIRLGCLLQREDGGALEAQVALEVLRNLTHQALEGQLADE